MNIELLELNINHKKNGYFLNQSLTSYRLICIAGALLVPLFGIFHKLNDPKNFDSITTRIIIAFLFTFIFIFSYKKDSCIQKNICLFMDFLYYIVTIWILYINLLNQFSYEHSMALMMVVFGSIVVGFRKNQHLISYCVVILSLTIFTCFLVTEPRIGRVLFVSNLVSISIISCIVSISNIKTQEKLVIREELMKTIFNEGADALFLVSRITQVVISCNNYASIIFEVDEKQELIGSKISKLHKTEFIQEKWTDIIDLINKHGSWSKEVEYITKKGRKIWGDLVIKEIKIAGETILLVRISDITERKQAEEALQKAYDELERRVEERTAELSSSNILLKQEISDRQRAEEELLHSAFHDSLTGLPNRALFMDRLGHAVERAKRRENYLFALLFLDLDRFKVVNDSLGHMAGDQLLLAIASRITACLRSADTLARLGGDEFTILLEDIKDLSDAKRVANRIHEELMLPFNLSGNEVFTSASIGIALSATVYDRPEQLLRDADTAMYQAKARGKARHEVFDIAMHASAIALLQLETDLRRALERQEFRIYYQPIVSLLSGRIKGFEALVRWQHPERGLVSPTEFIPVAEETGLMIPIGWWVFHEACRQMHLWQVQFPANPPLTISVNLSDKQFSQPNLSEQIEKILHETSLDPRSLKLEITESVIMENAESATTMLSQLRSLGVQLYMDDFGTGYSSLSYLHRFPLDMLKIDRSFVSRMGVGDENSEIVRAIVTLAHNLSMNVTAEGVETTEQLALLQVLQCEYGQGYFFSKPVDAEAAAVLIAEQL